MKDALIQEVNDLKARITVLDVLLKNTKDKIAQINCPFEPGDLIIDSNGTQAMVQSITSKWDYDDYELIVRKFKKSGEPYANDTVGHSWQKWELITFRTKEEAIEVRKQAEYEYNFHENHGKTKEELGL